MITTSFKKATIPLKYVIFSLRMVPNIKTQYLT